MRKLIKKWWPLSPVFLVIVACGGSGNEIVRDTQVSALVRVADKPTLLRPNQPVRARVSSLPFPGETANDSFSFVAEVDPPGAATVTFDKASAVINEEVGMTITANNPDSLMVNITVKRTNPKNFPTQGIDGDKLVTYTTREDLRTPMVDDSVEIRLLQSPLTLFRGRTTRVKLDVRSKNGNEVGVLQGVEMVAGGNYGCGVVGDNPCTVPATGSIEKEVSITPAADCAAGSFLYILYDPVTKVGRGAALIEFTAVQAMPGTILLELQPASLSMKPHYGGISMARVTSLNGYAGDVTVAVQPFGGDDLSVIEPTKPTTVKLGANGSAEVKLRFYRIGEGTGPAKVMVKATTPDGFSVEQPIMITYE